MVPTPKDLDRLYADQVRRLDTLLAGPEHVVEANELLRRLIARVVVRPDPEAPDGPAVELQGDLSWVPIGSGVDPHQNPVQGSLRRALSFQEQAPTGARTCSAPPQTVAARRTGDLVVDELWPGEPSHRSPTATSIAPGGESGAETPDLRRRSKALVPSLGHPVASGGDGM